MAETRREEEEAAAAEQAAAAEMAAEDELAEEEAAAEAAAEDEAWAGDEPLPEPEDPLEAELIAMTAERDELRDRLMRALAEVENIRKRAERDRRDGELYGGTRLARDLLAVHDNLGRALDAADDDAREKATAVLEGVEITRRELLNAFAKHRIEMVEPELGERFDPKAHQAMFEAPAPGAEPGTVIQVMQTGFNIAGRLLRPAMVGVAAAQPGEAMNAAAEDDGAEKEPNAADG